MDKIAELCVRRPITTLMFFVAFVVLGGVAYRQLSVQLLPDITLPTIGIWAQRNGSADDNLEKLTRPLEGLAAELPKVESIRSFTGPDFVWIQVSFGFDTDMRLAAIDLGDRIVRFQQTLDDRRVMINSFPFSTSQIDASYMFLSVQGKGDADSLVDLAKDRIEQQLKSIDGVAKVEIQGTYEDAARVTIRTDQLAEFGLNFQQVFGRINSAARDDSYLGRLRSPGETFYVRMDDRVRTVEELGRIHVDNNGIVELKDVATIETGKAVDSWVFRANGMNSIGIEMERESGTNMIELAQKTRRRIEEINRTLPPGVEVIIDEDLASYVEDAIGQVKELALVGALLSLFVPLIFFRSFRISIIVFLAVPICLISVFNLFLAAGMTINIFSIVGLALGVGMVVDNSIIVAENCFRLLQQGRLGPKEAAILGGGEVARALFASTLTTGIVFLPMIFVEGEFRLFVKEPTLALVFPLFISFFVATTLTPVLVYLLISTGRKVRLHEGSVRMREAYRLILKFAIRRRASVILVLLGLITFTLYESFSAVEQRVTNQNPNDNFIRVFLRVPPSSTLSEANMAVSIVESRLAQMEDIERFGAAFNSSGGRFNIRLYEPKDRPSKKSTDQIRMAMVDEIGAVPNAELSLRRFDIPASPDAISFGQRGVIELRGPERLVLDPYAERLIESLRNHPQITNAKIEEEQSDPLYLVNYDRERAAIFGTSARTLSEYIGATRDSGAISGLRLADGDRRTDVTIAIDGVDGGTVDDTRALNIFTERGIAQLGDLSSMMASQTGTRIRRTNRQSSIEVAYYWQPGADSFAIAEDIKTILRTMPNPAGVEAEIAGEAKRIDQEQANQLFIIFSGTILVFIVMAAVFESLWVPFIIVLMVSLIPLGIKWALVFAGLPMDSLARFGGILLIGLVVNAGIVMMDRALDLIRLKGYSRIRAVFSASDTRLRPILMTYLTTILGLLPMAMTGDETSQWRPVAVVIIGGLTSATVLTMVALPSFYLIGDDVVRLVRPYLLASLRGTFVAVERTLNLATRLLIGIFAPWRWRPLGWTREGYRFLRHRAWPFIITSPGRSWRFLTRNIRRTLAYIREEIRTVAIFISALGPRRDAVARTPEPAETPAPHRHGAISMTEPITLSNIQVIYPLWTMRSLRHLLPGKRYALGRRPLEGVHALHGISAEIPQGLYGLVGPNGAGKTTLLRCIAGLLEPTRGTVRLFGVAHREARAELAPLIGYLPQSHGHYEAMSLYEYLEYFSLHTARTILRARALHQGETSSELLRRLQQLNALSEPVPRDRAIRRAVEEVNLSPHLHEKIGGFSGGMKQRAGIARILLQAPPILIVDEPTAGLDPVERVKVRLLLSQLAAERTVLFSTHIVEDLEHTCQAVGVLIGGRLAFHGTPDRLKQRWNEQVFEVLANPTDDPESFRQSLLARGCRVLFQVARGGREGFRVLGSREAMPEGATLVPPTLEDALLATLGERRAAHQG